MNAVRQDAIEALKIIDQGQLFYPRFMSRSPIYAWTTENLTDYYNQIDFSGKKVLTVASSGDHALNAFLYGAKSVETFDVNRLQRYMQDLKLVAVRRMDHDTFMEYFNAPFDSRKIFTSFSERTYQCLREELPCDTRTFWDMIYQEFSGPKIVNEFFLEDRILESALNDRNPYTTKENYQRLQGSLKKQVLPFQERDLLSLPSQLEMKTYDIILLSNISQYVLMTSKNECPAKTAERKQNFYKTIVELMEQHLNPSGLLVAEYLYPKIYQQRKESLPNFYDGIPSLEQLHIMELERYLPSEPEEKKDHVVILQKKR